jgi:beta-lactamase class A
LVNRRAFVIGTTLVACTNEPPAAPVLERGATRIADIERDVGGRIGVCALETGSGGRIVHRARERFAMCSTFKCLLVAAICAKADRGLLELDESVAAQCDAAIIDSSNEAANALLKRAGGPSGVTQWLRTIGDETTRIDRDEPSLNDNEPGDPRDTTTPEAMVQTMRTVVLGNVLTEQHRTRIAEAMKRCRTGTRRLRAGMPKDWTVGDKTGTGDRGAVNDIAIVWRKYHSPILIASFMTGVKADLDAVELAHTRIGRIVAETFA